MNRKGSMRKLRRKIAGSSTSAATPSPSPGGDDDSAQGAGTTGTRAATGAGTGVGARVDARMAPSQSPAPLLISDNDALPPRSPIATTSTTSTSMLTMYGRVVSPPSSTGSSPARRRSHKSIAWVPDNLAERCYKCQAAFTLMLRRHHCRRCGNVFCDACSQSRMPLVSAGFPTPVRVCDKCSGAAKRAHARLVEDRQQHRLSDHRDAFQQQHDHSNGHRQTPPRGGALYQRQFSATMPLPVTSSPLSGAAPASTDMASSLRAHGTLPRSSDRATRTRGPSHGQVLISSRGHHQFMHHYQPAFTRTCTTNDHFRSPRSISAPTMDALVGNHYYDGSHSIGELHEFDDEEDEERKSLERRVGLCDDGDSSSMCNLPGEMVMVRSEGVRLLRALHLKTLHNISGTLIITNYRLIFNPYVDETVGEGGTIENCIVTRNQWARQPLRAYLAIPLMAVEHIKRKETAETDSGFLDLTTKDFRHVQLSFQGLVSNQTFNQFDRTITVIRQYAFGEPTAVMELFARVSAAASSFSSPFIKSERTAAVETTGSTLYNAVTEFQRMGVVSGASNNRWRISPLNSQYQLCATYPSLLAVPAAVSDEVLSTAATFRSKARIPVLSWRDSQTGVVICRSSQPLVGLGQRQCDMDVALIQAISVANPSSSKLVIIDARPWKNAVAQKTVGRAGYELTEHYETRHSGEISEEFEVEVDNKDSGGAAAAAAAASTVHPSLVLTECKLIFMGIENIHIMRKSYNKLLDLCIRKRDNDDKWLEHLASTRWMDHLSKILDSAVEIVRIVREQKSSVLVHCSDGWDRTAQLVSLAELMLDPYYRTIDGFQVLIEKEWCSFGHKFRARTGHGINPNASSDISPVFLQWIDCVWQIHRQFPCAFEFSDRFLILILDHLYSCRFGTFLYDSERERRHLESRMPTGSLWAYLRSMEPSLLTNPYYLPPRVMHKTDWATHITMTRQRRSSSPISVADGNIGQGCNNQKSRSYTQTLRQTHGADSHGRTTQKRDNDTLRIDSDDEDNATTADLDEFMIAIRSEITNDELKQDLPSDLSESHTNYVEESVDGSSHCFHQIIHDLDYGSVYPRPTETGQSVGTLQMGLAPSIIRSSGAVAVTPDLQVSSPSSPSSSSTFAPLSSTMGSALSESDGDGATDDNSEKAMDNDTIVGHSLSATCDDILLPATSTRALTFWSGYYLRWHPSSATQRHATVVLEAMHRDLVARLEYTTSELARLSCHTRRRDPTTESSSSSSIGNKIYAAPFDDQRGESDSRGKMRDLLERRQRAIEAVNMEFEDELSRMLNDQFQAPCKVQQVV